MEQKVIDVTDLLVYRELVNSQPKTEFQQITLEIVDKAIENLKAKSLL